MASVCFCSRFNPLKVDSSLIPCRNFVAARSILAFSNPKGRQRFGAIGVTKGRRSAVAANMFKIEREPLETGQESVWDYPRPPRLEPVEETISVKFNSAWIAHTQKAYRVLETSHPPVYYIPKEDINMEYVSEADGSSFCEWKGNATYWTVSVDGKTLEKVGWSYEKPTSAFQRIKGYVAFYASEMDCFVGAEKAEPQPGGFYGGWVTSKIKGPFKGGPGSWGW